jgi:hypothetical protein
MVCWVDGMQEWGRQDDKKLVKNPTNKACKFPYGHGLLTSQRESSVELLHFSTIPM